MSIETDTFDYQSLYLDFCVYLNKKKKSLSPYMSPIQRIQHVCSPHCEVFHHKERYVCLETGNIHHCSPHICTLYMVTRDANVCPVSKLSWDLDIQVDIGAVIGRDRFQMIDYKSELEVPLNTINPLTEKKDKPHLVTGRKKRKKTNDRLTTTEDARIEEDTYLHADAMTVLKQLCVSRARRQLDSGNYRTADRRVAASFRRYLHFRTASNLPLNLTTLICIYLAENKKRYRKSSTRAPSWRRSTSPPDSSVLERLHHYAQKCVQFWHLLSPLKPPTSKLNRYRYVYHCISLLYTLVKGVRNATGVFLEPDTQLGRLLPSIQHLHQLGYNQKVFTQHNEALLLRLAMNAQLAR
jgi:hypothetical protein